MDNIVAVLIQSGVTGVVVATVMVLFLAPAIQKAIEHSYAKAMEHVKVDLALIQKRYDLATDAMKQLAILYEDLLREIQDLKSNPGEKLQSRILDDIHPRYRGRYRVIRSQLEPANDLLSFYSISFDGILHPQSVKSLLAEPSIKSASDVKYAYRTLWLSVIEGLQSLMRVSASHKFWPSEAGYPDRARAWAEHDKRLLEENLRCRFAGKFSATDYYSLQLEREGGVERFWSSLPHDA